MQFLIMHKMTPEAEAGPPPDPAMIAAVGNLCSEAGDGVFLLGAGLKPSSQRTHITYASGKRTVTDGPFTNPGELVGSFVLLQVTSRDAALAWCDRLAAVLGDVELFLGPVVEPWDIGLAPKPASPPPRYLAMPRIDARAERDAPPVPAEAQKMAALVGEMRAAGVVQASGALASTAKGARVRYAHGKHTVTDGPFTESKELVAGFALLELPSRAAAVEWAIRFGYIVKVNEVEVRQMRSS